MSSYQTKRATVDDLAQLIELWRAAQLPAESLEKSFNDFLVAEDEQGKLVAAVALHIHSGNGRIHSETYSDFALADAVRPALWDRLQRVAQNHGLFRLWTVEAAPWWKRGAGFAPATEEALQKMPEAYGERHSGWLFLRLRDEMAEDEFLEKEIARFRDSERQQREVMLARAQTIRVFGTALAVGVFLFAITVLILLVRRRFFSHH